MTVTVEDLDKELGYLANLVHDFRDGSPWEIIWTRIDCLLEERGKLSVEVIFDEHDNRLRCDKR